MSGLWIDLGIILILVAGIAQFRTPRAARRGNLTAAAALLCAVIAVLVRHGVLDVPLVAVVAVLGSCFGGWVATRVNMIQIPAMVAFQHGAGGVAALLVSFVELTRDSVEPLARTAQIAALLGLVIGAATFSGSLIASGKLANRLQQTPTNLPRHNQLLVANLAVLIVLGVWAGVTASAGLVLVTSLALIIAGAVVLGVIFAIRIGGADMPVLISFLNATAGLAAAFCGIAIGNRLLIACGATVAASGSILTHVMCRAMNRGLTGVFAGLRPHIAAGPLLPAAAATPKEPSELSAAKPADPCIRAAQLLRAAQRVIIIPGYGMALAEASEEVVRLGEQLTALNKEVLFAIHPVAGRMPGHMHVLLAEAEVDYGKLRELKDVNGQFVQTDVALVVGACDVVNPAAIEASNTPISGMPILRADEARHVVVCNLDERPGYSGVPNPLYRNSKTILLLGDAQATVGRLRQQLEGHTHGAAATSETASPPLARELVENPSGQYNAAE
ncbi:MAG: NAD(P)(+) transhydrogenase (Re/Si-specific) subunit beta [Planctomycetota bacterium]